MQNQIPPASNPQTPIPGASPIFLLQERVLLPSEALELMGWDRGGPQTGHFGGREQPKALNELSLVEEEENEDRPGRTAALTPFSRRIGSSGEASVPVPPRRPSAPSATGFPPGCSPQTGQETRQKLRGFIFLAKISPRCFCIPHVTLSRRFSGISSPPPAYARSGRSHPAFPRPRLGWRFHPWRSSVLEKGWMNLLLRGRASLTCPVSAGLSCGSRFIRVCPREVLFGLSGLQLSED